MRRWTLVKLPKTTERAFVCTHKVVVASIIAPRCWLSPVVCLPVVRPPPGLAGNTPPISGSSSLSYRRFIPSPPPSRRPVVSRCVAGDLGLLYRTVPFLLQNEELNETRKKNSGVAVSEDVLAKYQELKLGHSLRYALFKMNADQSAVVVDATAGPTATYEEFVKALPANDCRYAVFDFPYEADGGQRNKILFIVWAPDSAKIKAKMLYASTRDAVRKKLVGVGTEIQATDLAEIDREAVLEKVMRV